MASESQKQKSLLSSGALGRLGVSPKDIQLDAVEKVISRYVGLIVTRYQDRINGRGSDADSNGDSGREITASGRLSASIRGEYTQRGRDFDITIYMADYADYVDKGVQGIGPGNKNTTSPYRFKFRYPSRTHVAAIEAWIKAKNVTAIITKPKGLNIGPAYSIAMSIKKKGLSATNFKQRVIDSVLPKLTEELASALAKDVVVSFTTDGKTTRL